MRMDVVVAGLTFQVCYDPGHYHGAIAGDPAALQMMDGLVNIQAAMVSYIDDFYLMMWVSLAAIPLALILRRPERA